MQGVGRLGVFLGLALVSWAWSGFAFEGINWGTQSAHPLDPAIIVQMLKNNGMLKVKLFDYNSEVLSALAGSDIEVMVAIPNDHLQTMTDADEASSWVEKNVANYLFDGGVNIKYVAVGNEPFLTSYNGSFLNNTYPALQNIQNALTKNSKVGDKVKATVPLNADVYTTNNTFPSGGIWRPDISQLMTQIVSFLSQNSAPFTVNIYPFLSLYSDASFPKAYAYFDGGHQIQDGPYVYTNVFDASYDTLLTALTSSGFPNIEIIIGEIGWPTDGHADATLLNAQKFNQGFLNHISSNVGTPLRPKVVIEYYLFGLLDEDVKSIAPGSFERHWGVFRYDGQAKYALSLDNSNAMSTLISAQGVKYLEKQWCVFNPNGDASKLAESVDYACTFADCTALGYGSSCNLVLDGNGNASYAFNQYFQTQSQIAGSCVFNGIAQVTTMDPSINSSIGSCFFPVGLVYSPLTPNSASPLLHNLVATLIGGLLLPLLLLLLL